MELMFVVIIGAFAFPCLIWLFLTFTRYADNRDNPKRKMVAFGFVLLISLFGLINRVFLKLDDSSALTITITIIVVTSIYMLIVVVKDKRPFIKKVN